MKNSFTVKLSALVAVIVLAAGVGRAQEIVDLGLSVRWASCNLGATEPEQAGNYCAWGETKPKPVYSWKFYKWFSTEKKALTKYNYKADMGTVDNRMVLAPEDDAAYVQSNGLWRMPTREEFVELIKKCSWQCVTINGMLVFEGRSRINGNKILLPLGGVWDASKLDAYNDGGLYWTSSIDEGKSEFDKGPSHAWMVYMANEITDMTSERYQGLSIRPVTDRKQ